MKKINLLLIALGFHSKRIYVPIISALSRKYRVEVCGIVELIHKEKDIRQYFANAGKTPSLLLTESFKNNIPTGFKKKLSSFVKKNDIQGVLITTEPLLHKSYAEWALSEKLHILMDKPITSRYFAATNPQQARGIYEDYMVLLNMYNRFQKNKQTIFTINVQRRYHPGFLYVLDEIESIARISGCPVTNIHSMHCDGEWRLPLEVQNGYYHSYSVGNGKASHSGYHFYDINQLLYTASTKSLNPKKAGTFTSMSSMVYPLGLLKILHTQDYVRYFGEEYNLVKPKSEKQLSKSFRRYGEVDVSTLVTLQKGKDAVGILSFNLVHNGFTRRTWLYPKKDLYKGNGRVRHEYHNIQQGPFQNIQIHSYQANDNHIYNNEEDFMIGGNNHFEVYIFRNPKFTKNTSSLEIISLKDLSKKYGYSDTKLVSEQVKKDVIVEFLEFIRGNIKKRDLKSNIDSHKFSVKIMSSVYESLANQYNKRNPLITKRID